MPTAKTHNNRKARTKGLSNPAVIAAAASPAGQKAITFAVDSAERGRKKAGEIATSVLPFMIKAGVVVAIVYVGYRLYANRFVSAGYNTKVDPANISDAQAQAKADAVYTALFGIGADFEAVKEALAGLNQNGFIKVYNAFGKRKPAFIFGNEMTLTEWLNDQLSNSEKEELRFLIGNVI